MAVISVRVNQKESDLLQQAAKMYGCPVSSLLKRLTLEKLEDDYDLALVRQYEADKKSGKVTTRDFSELRDELDL